MISAYCQLYITLCLALHFFNETFTLSSHYSGQTWPTLLPKVRTKAVCGGEPPAHQTLNKTTSLPPSSFTLQGRLTLATPLQLACSLWCGLSGGEHTSAAPCSPNEMPVSEGASRTVKKKPDKKKKKPPGLFMHHLMGGGGGY